MVHPWETVVKIWEASYYGFPESQPNPTRLNMLKTVPYVLLL